jgi:hypothetical protein
VKEAGRFTVAHGEFLDWEFSTRSGKDELFIPCYFHVRHRIAIYQINYGASCIMLGTRDIALPVNWLNPEPLMFAIFLQNTVRLPGKHRDGCVPVLEAHAQDESEFQKHLRNVTLKTCFMTKSKTKSTTLVCSSRGSRERMSRES